VVLTHDEVKALFSNMTGTGLLVATGSLRVGLRLMELARLRVKDIDFNMQTLTVRSGKGDKDRTTVLPESVMDRLRVHMEKVRALHEKDLKAGYGKSIFLTPWKESIKMQRKNGDGSLSSPLRDCLLIPGAGRSDASYQ